MHARYLTFLAENAGAFHATRGLLEDLTSRDLFDKLVLFRLLGHLHVRLPVRNRESLHRGKNLVPSEWKIDDTGEVGPFGPLSIFCRAVQRLGDLGQMRSGKRRRRSS